VIQDAISESFNNLKSKRRRFKTKTESSQPAKKVTPIREEFSDESDPEGFCDGLHMFKGLPSLSAENNAPAANSQNSLPEIVADVDAMERETHLSDNADQSDDDLPEEVAIVREAADFVVPVAQDAPSIASGSNVKEKSAGHDRMQKLRMLRVLAEKKFVRNPFRVNSRRSVPPTLLEKLLAKDIEMEHSELLQCVKYVVENSFFGVGQHK
jgi:hypothetical protein